MESNGCVGVLLTFGEPTGLELPEVEVPGSGRLLPAVGEIAGGVTEDITMVGGLTDESRLIPDLFSFTLESTHKVDIVDITGEVLIDIVVVLGSVIVETTHVFPLIIKDDAVIIVFVSIALVPIDWVLASILLDLSLLSVLLCASRCSLRWKKINEQDAYYILLICKAPNMNK